MFKHIRPSVIIAVIAQVIVICVLLWFHPKKAADVASIAPSPVTGRTSPIGKWNPARVEPVRNDAQDAIWEQFLSLLGLPIKERLAALDTLLSQMTGDQLEAGLNLLSGRTENQELQPALAHRLASLDSVRALRWLLDGRTEVNATLATAIFDGLSDIKEGLKWLDTLPPSTNRDAMLDLALGRWAGESGSEALQYALTESQAENRPSFITKAIASSFSSSPAQRFEWAWQYLGEHHDPVLLRQTACIWACENYDGAYQRVSEMSPSDAGREQAIAGLIDAGMNRDLSQAFPLIDLVQDTQNRHDFYFRAAREWFRQDAASARDWIATTPELQENDRFVFLPQADNGITP